MHEGLSRLSRKMEADTLLEPMGKDVVEEPKSALFEAPFPLGQLALDMLLLCAVGGCLGLFAVGYVRAVKTVPELWLTVGLGNSTFITHPQALDWAQGQIWWIAIGAGAGLFTGLYKAALGLDEFRGFADHLAARHVGVAEAVHTLILCLASNFAGASLGPEAGMAGIGAVAGLLVSRGASRVFRTGTGMQGCVAD